MNSTDSTLPTTSELHGIYMANSKTRRDDFIKNLGASLRRSASHGDTSIFYPCSREDFEFVDDALRDRGYDVSYTDAFKRFGIAISWKKTCKKEKM